MRPISHCGPVASHCHQSMAEVAEQSTYKKLCNSTGKTISLAISAGIFIGLAFVFYITVTTGAELLPWGLKRLLGGLAFSMGLMLIVVCGGDLFTSSVLSIIPRANKKIDTKHMLANWSKVYFGNFIGATALVLVVMTAKLYALDGGLWGANALHIAAHKLEHSFSQALMLGLLCNLLVCLAIWMTFSTTSSTNKALLVCLPVAMFVSTGFEHIVANMFMVPLGIGIKAMAGSEFWQQTGLNASQFAHLTWGNFIQHNVIPVTIGNILGGALIVGMGYWSIYHRSEQSNVTKPFSKQGPMNTNNSNNFLKIDTLERDSLEVKIGDMNMNALQKLRINDAMIPVANKHVVLADTSISEVAEKLINNQQTGVFVVDNNMQLEGYVSEVDVLKALWLADYQSPISTTISSILQKEVTAVAKTDHLLKLAEYMSVDLSQLYPVNDNGMLMRHSAPSLCERLQASQVYRPKMYPVIEEGKLIGVISRHDVLSALRPILNLASDEETGEGELIPAHSKQVA